MADYGARRRPAAIGARVVLVGWGGGLIYSRPDRQKLRNIGRNPRVGFNPNSNDRGGAVVRAEGGAEIVEDAPPATEIPEYLEKYRDAIARIGYDEEGFARVYSRRYGSSRRADRSGRPAPYDHCVCGFTCSSPSTSRSTFSLKKQRWSLILSAAGIGSG